MERMHPGDFIADELEARGWSKEILYSALSLSQDEVLDLLAGNRKVTVLVAEGLSSLFGTSALVWLNLQKQREQWEAGCD